MLNYSKMKKASNLYGFDALGMLYLFVISWLSYFFCFPFFLFELAAWSFGV